MNCVVLLECNVMLCTVLCYIVMYCIVLACIVLNRIVLYCVGLNCIRYCTVSYFKLYMAD